MTTFYLVRHGITQSNVDGRHLGQKIDEDLTPEGLQQAKGIADLLKNETFAVIYSSPLIRAVATANEIAKYHQSIGPVIDPRLTELHMGVFEGKLEEFVARNLPREHQARIQDKFGFQVPGGESYAMLMDRVEPFVRQVRAQYPGGNVCIVGHQGLNCGLLGVIGRGNPSPIFRQENIPRIKIPHDAYIKVSGEGSGIKTQVVSGTISLDIETT